MTKKDEVQEKIRTQILENEFKGIVLSSVRSGKTRILLNCVKTQTYFENPRVLILYPNVDIKVSWENEQELIGFKPNITYCTFASIHTQLDKEYDIVLVDEAHLLGEENQLPMCAEIVKKHKCAILASGTFSSDTMYNIIFHTGFKLIVNYPTEKAIEDGLVSDYKVFIHSYNVDNTIKKQYGKAKKWQNTELGELNRMERNIMFASNERLKMFHSLERMRFINTCDSLKNAVSNWISENQNKRFLMFCADSKISEYYGLPTYNSKSNNDSNLGEFQIGRINQLVLVKKAAQGVTFPNLDTVLITAINSNNEVFEQMLGRSLLKDTDEAKIHVFVSNMDFQIKWMNKALIKVPSQKIIRVN
jgi:superfamily II DNA or RNA helicase